MLKKNVFLLNKAVSYRYNDISNLYNDDEKINILSSNGKQYPLVLEEMSIPTMSKTLMAPGDDDPDPEDERCY